MNPVFTVIYVIWFLSETLLNRLLRSKSTDKQNADKNSLLIIWITVVATIILAMYISINYYFPIYPNIIIRYIGLGIIVLGIVLRIAAVLSLGKFFTVDVTIREDHKLKKDGVYKYLRHPSYFASLLSFIGFGLSINSWPGLILIVIAVMAVFIFRIKIEEKILIGQFGDEYVDYKKNTKGIIPFIY
ncbi:isoprenylcysteine carboxylmethyltransferase family protein [Dyadobacter sp. 3J3]|uniref:methyltransferase family protein n=1 Tax=Dyadobacter sp. 3J3 TaxID=2606600 RepID=UPI00135A0CE4|nr:isoprenylcysteine carboxylmethyltransferase family protein [Dyadobacter sp. 3J3]